MKFLNYCGKWYMKYLTLIVFTVAGFLFFYIVGCQDLDFSSIPDFDCEAELDVEGVSCMDPEMNATLYDEDGNPIEEDGGRTGNNNNNDDERDVEDTSGNTRQRPYRPNTVINTTLGKINILFVVDNSGSMTEELRSIATQFTSFLEDIKKTDYRIAIITTDWINDRGQFLPFPNGQKFLSNPAGNSSVHSQNVNYFQQVVKRPVGDNDDERGIYALNMALDNSSHSDFFRPHSLFMVIIVSDEDERSYGGKVPEGYFGEVPPLESYDLPDTFFRKVSHHNKYSIVEVHSIIIPPGKKRCPGVEGRIYAQASKPSNAILARYGNIRKGHVGSICSSNYSGQLGPIADTLLNVTPIPLPCFPIRESVSLQVEGRTVNFRLEDRKVIVEDQVSFGSNARVSFRCDKSRQQ